MKKTKITLTLTVFIISAILAYAIQQLLIRYSTIFFIPPIFWSIIIFIFAIIVLIFGLQIRKLIKKPETGQLNPFVAMRTVAAAKSAIRVGAFFAGTSVGILFSAIFRTVMPGVPQFAQISLCIVSSVILVIIGHIVENMCAITPEGTNISEKNKPSSIDPVTELRADPLPESNNNA